MKNTGILLSAAVRIFRNLFHVAALAGLVLFSVGCDDDDEGLHTQPHDQNKMMSLMHAMMDAMMAMAMNSEPDIDFARMMVLHHQGAINMAAEELARGGDAEMKALAQKIKTDQEKEIQDLQAFLNSYQADQPMIHAFHTEMTESMEKMGRESDLRVLTGDTDQDFAQLMIPHHQAAIENAHSVIRHGNSAELAAMAKKMIAAQTQEIGEFQEWLLKNKKY